MATLQGAANGELPTGTTGADSLTGRGVNRVWTSRPAPGGGRRPARASSRPAVLVRGSGGDAEAIRLFSNGHRMASVAVVPFADLEHLNSMICK